MYLQKQSSFSSPNFGLELFWVLEYLESAQPCLVPFSTSFWHELRAYVTHNSPKFVHAYENRKW